MQYFHVDAVAAAILVASVTAAASAARVGIPDVVALGVIVSALFSLYSSLLISWSSLSVIRI